MAVLPVDIAEMVASEKVLGDTPVWDDVSDPYYVVFTHALVIGSVATGGFQLRVKVSRRWVDRDALMQLEYAPAGRRSAEGLWRLDWKPFHSHGNKGLPADAAFVTYNGSHQHPFVDNFLPDMLRMRGSNLPCGRPFPWEPNSLTDFLALGGELFKIKDIDRIILPGTDADIFWQDDD